MKTIAIIGGGFSGTVLTAQLARHSWRGPPVRITLIERRSSAGRGIAYGSPSPLHVLNVPAGRMGAFSGDEGGFLRWLRRDDPDIAGDTFVPRHRYGDYLETVLADALSHRSGNVSVDVVRDTAVQVSTTDDRAIVVTASGSRLDADYVVLALGNMPPRIPGALMSIEGDPRFVRDPWQPGALAGVPLDKPVITIGSGLTMVDIALALRDANHRGGIRAISRRGLLPRAHRDSPTPPPIMQPPRALDAWNGRASSLLSIVRTAARDAEREGLDWRDVVNALRAATPALWARLTPIERARFCRHAQAFWDSHRHRMATAVATAVESMVASGELDIVAGRIMAVESRGLDPFVVHVSLAAGEAATYRAGAVVVCTGPDTDFARMEEPLIAGLRADGHLAADPLALGILTDDQGALLRHDGVASRFLYTIGSARRASLWESTAVPELREQAAALAATLHRTITKSIS